MTELARMKKERERIDTELGMNLDADGRMLSTKQRAIKHALLRSLDTRIFLAEMDAHKTGR